MVEEKKRSRKEKLPVLMATLAWAKVDQYGVGSKYS